MVCFGPAMISRARKGADGKTAYERQHGHAYTRQLPVFVEQVMFLPLGPRPSRLRDKFVPGVFAGLAAETDALVVLTPEGALKTRTMRRLAPSEQFDLDYLNQLQGVP